MCVAVSELSRCEVAWINLEIQFLEELGRHVSLIYPNCQVIDR